MTANFGYPGAQALGAASSQSAVPGPVGGNQIDAAGRPANAGLTSAGQTAGPAGFSAGYVGPQLTLVTIGNSINGGANNGTTRNNGAGADPAGWWSMGSDVHIANSLADSPCKFARITATTRCDRWGNYSYSGQTLATILADIPAQVFDALDAASVKPDIIMGHSLLENDIPADATYAQLVSRIQQFIYYAKGRCPSARIWLCTPRPSFSYNSATRQAVYASITQYMLALDNGRDIFVSLMNGYEDPKAPGQPLAGYTDATVHPTVAGGWVNGRKSLLPTLRRIVSAAFPAYTQVSTNFALTGTTGTTGSNVSGTTATGTSHGNPANGRVALVANQPSVTLTYTQRENVARDMSTFLAGQHTVSGFSYYSPYIKVRIDSGAENIRMVGLQPRGSDGVTPTFMFMWADGTSDTNPSPLAQYENGDVFTFRMPPVGPSDFGLASLTSIYTYLRTYRKIQSGVDKTSSAGDIVITVLDAGVGNVA